MLRATPSDPTQAYRRQARRLRARYASRPTLLYRSLKSLSDRHDAQQPAPVNSDFNSDSHRTDRTADVFAQHVTEQLEAGVLRYSRRVELLGLAERLGIGRFDANLMIAAVQHQLGLSTFAASTDVVPAPIYANRWVVFGVLQGSLLLAAWALFLH